MLKPLHHLVRAALSRPTQVAMAIALTMATTATLPVFAADPAAEAKAVELTKIADEVKVREDAAAAALKELQKKQAETQASLIKLKAEISAADKAVKENEPKVKPEEEKVAKADAAKKAADEALAAAKKAVDDNKTEQTEAKFKEEEGKNATATKALTDAQAALKAIQDAITNGKAKVEGGPAAQKQIEEQLAAIGPQVQAAAASLATVKAEHVEKRRAAEKQLIELGKLVSFSQSVAPVLSKRCLACHNAKTAKGRYNMETFAGIVKGGESGPAAIAGKSGESSLHTLIADGSMPKDADPLTKEQIELIKKWIDTGAVLDAGFAPNQPLIQIVPKEKQPPAPEKYPVPIPVTAVAFNHDGSLLATSGYHEVILWNVADGAIAKRITNVAERVYDIEFSKDGATMIVAAGTPAQIGEVKLFNVADGNVIGDLVRSDDAVFGIALSPDGTKLATAGADRAIRVFEVATQKQVLNIEDHADWVMDIAWSPDGKKLASASRDKTSKVFDANTGDSLVTFNAHGDSVYSVGFSTDGAQVVTAGNDKQIRIWAAGDAKQVRNMGFGGEVFRVAITPDGQVFSCSADKTARSHKVADGAAVKTFNGHTDWVYSVAVHPGAKRVAAGSYNGEVRIWNVDDAAEVKKILAAPGYEAPAAK